MDFFRSPFRRHRSRLLPTSIYQTGRLPEWTSLEVHSAARGHAATAAAGTLLGRHFGDHRLGGDQEARDRSRALKRLTHDLGRIDDALGEHVDVFAVLRVEAVRILI